MGFDCTLHIVDENSLHRFNEYFFDRLSKTPFEKSVKNHKTLLKDLKKQLQDKPAEGGRALAHMALLFASAEAPHLYCRGFALSLWEEDALGNAPWLHTSSPTPWLKEIFAAYPESENAFPDMFDGNYCTGAFVSAARVPALLKHVENALEQLPPGMRKDYLPLRTVLRVAAEKKMAYWEATDLQVIQPKKESKWLEQSKASTARWRKVKIPVFGILTRPESRHPTLLDMSDYSSYELAIHDLTKPDITAAYIKGVFARNGTFTDSGIFYGLVSTNKEERPRGFRVVRMQAPYKEIEELTLEIPFVVNNIIAVKEEVLIFPDPQSLNDGLPICIQIYHPEKGLSEAKVPPAVGVVNSIKNIEISCDAVSFGDGSYFVVWDAKGYRYENGVFTPLGIEEIDPEYGAPSGESVRPGEIIYLSDRVMYQISRDGKQTALYSEVDNIMEIGLMEGAILLKQGDNLEGDALKIIWTDSNEISCVDEAFFGLNDRPSVIRVLKDRHELFIIRGSHAACISLDELQTLPRIPYSKFQESHAKLIERKNKKRNISS